MAESNECRVLTDGLRCRSMFRNALLRLHRRAAEVNKVVIAALGLSAACGIASAQLNPSIPLQVQPVPLRSQADAMQQAAAIRAARAQAELLEAQARLLDQQTRNAAAQTGARATTPTGQGQANGQQNPVLQEWLRAAGPRLHLYPDFQSVVLTPEVRITEDMIRLMAGSPLAADIAYYFGKNRFEALAVSQMTLLDAARAVDRIERNLKDNAAPLNAPR